MNKPPDDDLVDWKHVKCPCCHGSGKVPIMKEHTRCRKCDGTGMEWIAIPKETTYGTHG